METADRDVYDIRGEFESESAVGGELGHFWWWGIFILFLTILDIIDCHSWNWQQ